VICITNTSSTTKLPPRCRRHADARDPHPLTNGNNRKDGTVRNTLIALAAATGLMGLGSVTTSAAPVIVPAHSTIQTSAVQQADWYCGPRCQYWHHRRWEEHHAWRYRQGYYGYNYNYAYPYGYYR
jgi:hypothetical protein